MLYAVVVIIVIFLLDVTVHRKKGLCFLLLKLRLDHIEWIISCFFQWKMVHAFMAC